MNPDILKNLKYNVIVNLLDGAFFGLGMGFASFVAILPLFVGTLTTSAMLIGLIPAIRGAGWLFPQILTAKRVAGLKRYKPMVLLMTLNERLPYLAMAGVAWALPNMTSSTALILTFTILSWNGLGSGLAANPWQSMIAKIIPSDYRGTFFGFQAASANLAASLSAILAGLILQNLTGNLDYILCFLLAFASMAVSYIFLALTREPENVPREDLPVLTDFWGNVGTILNKDRNFRWYLVVRMLSLVGTMGFSFYAIYVIQFSGVDEFSVGLMTGAFLGSQIILNPLLGWLGDRWSHRGVMELGLVAALLSGVIAWQAPSPAWFYLSFVLAGTANVAIWTIGLAIILEFGSEEDRPAYIGLSNTLVAPVAILAPFLGGWLADKAGFSMTFITSAVASLATVIVLQFFMRDPRHERQKASLNSSQPPAV